MSPAELKRRLESRTGILFGYFRANNPNYWAVIRVGDGSEMVNFEAGVLGRSVYVDWTRVRSTPRTRTVRRLKGSTIREIWQQLVP